jgi:tRNA (Thr-GGU) A37 N-methylase
MMNKIDVFPLGQVTNTITETGKEGNLGIASEIIISEKVSPEAFEGIEIFSHLEVDFYFRLKSNQNGFQKHEIQNSNNFSNTRNSNAVLFGHAIVRLVKREGRKLVVSGFDVLNGTLILDIKPVMNEMLPSEPAANPDLKLKA